MRVVHIIDSGGVYGAEIMMMHLCQAQQLMGFDVEVISIGALAEGRKPLEKALDEKSISWRMWRMRSIPDLRQAYKIACYCRKSQADVIHSHGYKGNILLGLLPKAFRSVPVVSTVHGYTSQKRFGKMAINQWLDRACLKRLDAVVLVSDGMKHQVPTRHLSNKLHVVPNGIPEDEGLPVLSEVEYFRSSDLKVGAVGRLSSEKNFDMLIRSMSLIVERTPSAKLVIYGEGDERPRLEMLVERLGLKNSVFLPGYIDDPVILYQSIDVFVNSSLSEGMPITLIEALKNGCAIVATDIAANRCVLESSSSVAKLVTLSEIDMANRILEFSSVSTEERKALMERAKRLFKEKYTSSIMAAAYSDVYNVAISGRT